jgi:CrcB protein
MWRTLLLLSLAGAIGTLARYGLSGFVHRWAGEAFPWGVLVVNATGSLLFGLVWGLVEHRGVITPETRLIVLIGFMGAFTTFSTYAYETARLLQSSQWLYAAGNIIANNVVCVVLVLTGMAVMTRR